MSESTVLLYFGDLDLVGADGGYDWGQFQTIGEDVDLGEPQPIEETIATLMADGSRTETTGYDNREISFRVSVVAADQQALAEGEAALVALSGKRTTLAWTPSDGFAATTVFEVETSRMRLLFSDLDELRQVKRRTFQLTLACLPFGRSESSTTIGSEFVADSETIADDCESTAGWSVYGYGQTATITVDSTAGHFSTGTGAVKLEILPEVYVDHAPFVQPGGRATMPIAIRKTGLSIDASGGGYLVFRFRSDPTNYSILTDQSTFYITSSGGGRQEASLVSVTSMENGYAKYALLIPDNSTITTLEVEGYVATEYGAFPYGSKPPNPDLWFDSFGLAGGATENQAARTLAIGGTARSEGSFEISAAVGLGDVVFYTCPDLGDGFRPDLRRWTSAGTPTTDTAAINGSYIPADTGEFEAPTNIFRSGAYAVLARVRSTGGTTFDLNIDATTVLAGTDIGETYTVESGTITVADTTGYHVVRVGVLDLPPHKVAAAADAVIRFVLDGPPTVRVDEVMVFPLDDAALTWVECGSGAPSSSVASRVFIDGPSADLPLGQILVGNNAARSDARYIRPRSKGRHLLYPGQMFVYLLTSAAGGADMATTYFMHWHTWAGE